MKRFFEILLCVVFFSLCLGPVLYLFGAREKWTKIYGWEREVKVPGLSWTTFADRSFQNLFTENFAKNFFLRKTYLRTALQMREWANFGLFHYGYSCSILEGREGVIYEKPYADFHLKCPRPGGKAKYAEALKALKDMSDFCHTNGADFVFMPMPDKLQAYPEFLPRWFGWFWDYSNYDTQGELSKLCSDEGIAVLDMNRYLLDKKPDWKVWVYPPGGTHFNAYGNGLIYSGFVEKFVDTGRMPFKPNRFVGVRRVEEVWKDDDDISNLLNLWWNPHLKDNPHYAPIFEKTNVVMNAGSMVTVGDCYRDYVGKIFRDAKFFEPSKVHSAPRGKDQKPETYRPYANDLKLVMLTFQSFNTGRLDERCEELQGIFTALKTAWLDSKGKGTKQ